MGSQSVTDFSAARKKRVRQMIGSYSPHSSSAEKQVLDIGAAAVGTLGKGEANAFFQAMSSRSVETGIGLILSLADELKSAKNLQHAYEKYKVGPEVRQPFGIVSAFLTKELSDRLSTIQGETESAFAAKDAIPKTIVDVISSVFPRKREPAEVDLEEFAAAFKKVNRKEIATAFLRNAASALINLVLDATRGRLPPARVAELKQRIRDRFVPEFMERLMRSK
jgi:hypothetical protein